MASKRDDDDSTSDDRRGPRGGKTTHRPPEKATAETIERVVSFLHAAQRDPKARFDTPG